MGWRAQAFGLGTSVAATQNDHRLAWCLNVQASPQIYAATTDLREAAAVTNVGAFYTRRIMNVDAELVQSLPNLFYGMPQSQAVTFMLDNADLALSSSTDYRLTLVVLYRYDRGTDTKTTELSGLVLQAVTGNSTLVSGKLRLAVEYARPAPPSGN